MSVELREITQNDIKIIKPWLIDKENSKWLDPFFQNDKLKDEQLVLFLMRKDKKMYMIMCDEIPVGIMGLVEIDETNKSAQIWSLLGNRDYRKKGIITVGHVLALRKAFFELNLHSVNAWVADGNFTIRVCEKLNFKRIGRQRECHMMDGIFNDRILFDILKNEFDESALLESHGNTK